MWKNTIGVIRGNKQGRGRAPHPFSGPRKNDGRVWGESKDMGGAKTNSQGAQNGMRMYTKKIWGRVYVNQVEKRGEMRGKGPKKNWEVARKQTNTT